MDLGEILGALDLKEGAARFGSKRFELGSSLGCSRHRGSRKAQSKGVDRGAGALGVLENVFEADAARLFDAVAHENECGLTLEPVEIVKGEHRAVVKARSSPGA